MVKKYFFVVLISFALLVSAVNISVAASNRGIVYTTRSVTQEVQFWEDVVAKNPTYKDGYTLLAELYREAGEPNRSQEVLKRYWEFSLLSSAPF